ncbi:unnamed protein product [Heterobilharzia americana]|nr:unnamed protein product [Heterobilharzia americana]
MALDLEYFGLSNRTWSCLPYHIVRHIYSYLGNESIKVSAVCRHWRDVAYTCRTLWGKLRVRPSSFPNFEAFKNPILPLQICSEIQLEFDPTNELHAGVLEATLNSLCSNIRIHSISLRPIMCAPYDKYAAYKLDTSFSRIITALCEVIVNARCLKYFYWGGSFCNNNEVNYVLQLLTTNQKHNLLSLQIIRLLQMNQSMAYCDSKLFLFYNLSQFSTNYLDLSEDILLVLTRNSNQLRILKLFVQSSVQDLPLIRNQIWRNVHEILPNFRVNLFLICVKDLKQLVQSNLPNEHTSFISNTNEELNDPLSSNSSMVASYSITNAPPLSSSSHIPVPQEQEYEHLHQNHHPHVEQEQMYELLSTKLLPSALPLDSISIYYCKPDPLSYLIQYLMDTFSTSLRHFYLIDTFNTISVMSNNSGNTLYNISEYPNDSITKNTNNVIRFIANTPTTTTLGATPLDTAIDYDNYDCIDSDYQSMFSSHSSYHSLLLDSTSDFDILSCDSSYDLFDCEENSINSNSYYSGNLLLPVSTNLPLPSSSRLSSSIPVSGWPTSPERQLHQLSASSNKLISQTGYSMNSVIDSTEEKTCSSATESTMYKDINIKKRDDDVTDVSIPVTRSYSYSNDVMDTSKTNINNCDNLLYHACYSKFCEVPQSPTPSSSSSPPSNLIFYSPNMYKTLDDVNPDPFVMLAWRCQQLSHFTLIGYWFNIVDMKAFTALRGTSLKSFNIPRCCIAIDDQSWSFNLDENFNECKISIWMNFVEGIKQL